MAFLSNPTAAALPQDELSHMSRGQLVQCSNVLHAGWIAANQRMHLAERDAQLAAKSIEAERRSVLEERDQLASEVQELATALAHSRQAQRELERQVAKLRQSAAKGEDPVVADLRDKLLQRDAAIVQLERTIRLMTPVDVKAKLAQIEILERQREADKTRMQEDAVKIAELHERLRIAKEDLALSSGASPSSGPSPQQSPRGTRISASAAAAAAAATAAAARKASMKEDDSGRSPTLPPPAVSATSLTPAVLRPVRDFAQIRREADSMADNMLNRSDASVQTDTFLVKALDLLNQSSHEIDKLHRSLDAATDENKTLKTTLAGLRDELRTARESVSRKDELLDKLTRSVEKVSRSGSVVSGAGGDDGFFAGAQLAARKPADDASSSSAAHAATLRDKVMRLESQLRSTEAEVVAFEKEVAEIKRENASLKRGMLSLAEENATMSMQLQTVSEHSPKRLAELLAAEAERSKLRDEAAKNAALLIDAEKTRVEHERLSKEVAVLSGRVTRYQTELASVSLRRDALELTVQELTAALSETRRELEDALRAPPIVFEAPPRPSNAYAALAKLDAAAAEHNAAVCAEFAISCSAVAAALAQSIDHLVTGIAEAETHSASMAAQLASNAAVALNGCVSSEVYSRWLLSTTAFNSFDAFRSLAGAISAAALKSVQKSPMSGDAAPPSSSVVVAVASVRTNLTEAGHDDTIPPLPSLGLSLVDGERGVEVVSVDERGPAHFAEINVGDIIISFSGRTIATTEDFADALLANRGFTAFTAGVLRQGDRALGVDEVVVML